jgi:hypothetical protein
MSSERIAYVDQAVRRYLDSLAPGAKLLGRAKLAKYLNLNSHESQLLLQVLSNMEGKELETIERSGTYKRSLFDQLASDSQGDFGGVELELLHSFEYGFRQLSTKLKEALKDSHVKSVRLLFKNTWLTFDDSSPRLGNRFEELLTYIFDTNTSVEIYIQALFMFPRNVNVIACRVLGRSDGRYGTSGEALPKTPNDLLAVAAADIFRTSKLLVPMRWPSSVKYECACTEAWFGFPMACLEIETVDKVDAAGKQTVVIKGDFPVHTGSDQFPCLMLTGPSDHSVIGGYVKDFVTSWSKRRPFQQIADEKAYGAYLQSMYHNQHQAVTAFSIFVTQAT